MEICKYRQNNRDRHVKHPENYSIFQCPEICADKSGLSESTKDQYLQGIQNIFSWYHEEKITSKVV